MSQTEAEIANGTKTLPDGWRWVKLGEVCEQDREIVEPNSELAATLRYLGLEHIESDTGRVLREPAEQVKEGEGKSTTFAFDTRHVLYGKLRPYLNKVALPEVAGRCTTEIIPLLPKDGTDREFLCWLLRRPETVVAAMRDKTGSRMPRADMDELMELEVPLPPLAEQQRIVAILGEQMATVERARSATEAQLEAAKTLPAAYLRKVFDSPEAKRWPRKKLGEIAAITGGIQKTPDRAPSSFHRPYVTVRNVQRGYLDLSQVERFEITPTELSRVRLLPGDVLIVEGNGSKDHIGRNALFTLDTDEWIHQNHVIRVRLEKSVCLPEFVSRFLNSDQGKMQMLEKARTTSGLYTLSAGKVSELEVPTPPIAEQEQLSADLAEQTRTIEHIQALIEDKYHELERIPSALLRQAFSGQL